MDIKFKEDFIVLWKRFFGEAELPIAFYYTDEEGHAELVNPDTVRRCIFPALSLVRKGRALCFDAESIGCLGGQRYLGFRETEEPDIEYFLSCGIPGKVEGESVTRRHPRLLPGRSILSRRSRLQQGS